MGSHELLPRNFRLSVAALRAIWRGQLWERRSALHAVTDIHRQASPVWLLVACWQRPVRITNTYLVLIRLRSSLPLLKLGWRLAGTCTASPVRGLRPTRGACSLTAKEPNPRSSIRSPRANPAAIVSKMALTRSSTSRWTRCGFCATSRSMSCDRVMRPTAYLMHRAVDTGWPWVLGS